MSFGSPSRIPRRSARSSPLPSPPSLEIATILAQAGPFDDLKSLVSPLSFSGTSSDDESDLEDVPPFPKDHQPPIFIIQGHRAQVPFAVRSGVIALGDIHADEHTSHIVLSAPTIPRMNLVMKEQLFMNTWVERLTPQRPPRHIPWTSDNPVARHDWISEGSIFPAETIKSQNGKIRQARIDERVSNRPSNRTVLHSTPPSPGIRNHRETAVISKESPGRQAGFNQWSVHVPMTGIKRDTASSGPQPSTPIRGQMETRAQGSSDSPVLESYSDKTIKQLVSTCRKSSRALPQIGSIDSLAIRRGKKVSGLQLKEVDDLEYPDIPTAFRGSPTVWSPNFDPGVSTPNGKLFTDHGSMLSSLRLQYAALANGTSSPVTCENKECQDAFVDSVSDSVSSMPSSSRDDEWAFENDLDLDLQSPVDDVSCTPTPSFAPKNAPDRPRDALNFTPERCSIRTRPTRSPSPPRPQPAVPAVKISPAPLTGPPSVPLPPRPVLTNPSTPPRVRGILKKVKSVRFEDIRCSQDISLLVTPAPESSTAAKRPSPLRNSFIAPVDGAPSVTDANKPADAVPETGSPAPQPKADQGPVIKKKAHMMKSKLVPKGTILSSHRVSEAAPTLKFLNTNLNVCQEVPPTPELTAPATSTPGRHNRVASADKENGRTALARARKRWSTMNENDLRIGVEGAAPKSRLTTPLRNIFKFK
ncbi:uncharacterized protein EDB91DRAFT_1245788 [Suillus paluster]|uniref:uncharacterized protein n=1 Tax=Suillus paluster TaxID=48578 RepID=UPI001B864659|nr:uncharacterized protein EDB91DRAFT_1245788 [Suillus paluster]KAG1746597.1 hypothetical protein EDB91DRAFT_1245788 [Suillus paluster]